MRWLCVCFQRIAQSTTVADTAFVNDHTVRTQAVAMESSTTRDTAGVVVVPSIPWPVNTRAAALVGRTTRPPKSAVPTNPSSRKRTTHITPLVVGTSFTVRQRRAVVMVKCMRVTATSVAIIAFYAKITIPKRAAVGTEPTILTPTSVATASQVGSRTAGTLVAAVNRPTTTGDRYAATVRWITVHLIAGIQPAVEPSSTATTPRSAAAKRSWRRPTAMTPSAAATRSSITDITHAAVENLTTSPVNFAAMDNSRTSCSAPILAAASRPCTIVRRASVVTGQSTARRLDHTPRTAVADTSTIDTVIFAVPIAMTAAILNLPSTPPAIRIRDLRILNTLPAIQNIRIRITPHAIQSIPIRTPPAIQNIRIRITLPVIQNIRILTTPPAIQQNIINNTEAICNNRWM